MIYERSQSEKDTYCMISTCDILEKENYGDNKKSVVGEKDE